MTFLTSSIRISFRRLLVAHRLLLFSNQKLEQRPFGRVLLGLLSAASLICSLPNPDIGWLGWVALFRSRRRRNVRPVTMPNETESWFYHAETFKWRHAMHNTTYIRTNSSKRQSMRCRWTKLVAGAWLILGISGVASFAQADTVGGVLCKIITFGQACQPFTPGPEPAAQTVPVNCSNPVMTSAPRFLSTPPGSAKYPFTASCTSPARPGVMTVRWEGSWTPSETRQDRPNA